MIELRLLSWVTGEVPSPSTARGSWASVTPVLLPVVGMVVAPLAARSARAAERPEKCMVSCACSCEVTRCGWLWAVLVVRYSHAWLERWRP